MMNKPRAASISLASPCDMVGILFYPVAMMSVPLNSTLLNLLMCLVGGTLFGLAFGAAGNTLLRKRNLA